MEIKDVLNFEKMLTPKIILVVYYLALIGVIVSSVGSIFSGQFLPGIGILIFGAIGVRLWCEFIVVLFQLNKNVQKIADTK